MKDSATVVATTTLAVVAGHSVGEYAALVAAGALAEADAVKLTRLRGQLMETACPAGTGGMAAIMGAERADVEPLCQQVKEVGVAQVAALNTAGQVVIAGHIRALYPRMPIVLMTGNLDEPVKASVSFVLRKPFLASELVRALRQATGGRSVLARMSDRTAGSR